MNKTMTVFAVILSVITAFFLVNITDGTDGALPEGYKVISDADTVCYTDSTLPGDKLYITSSSIGADAFKGCTTITYVLLDKDVKTVGNSAFEGCTKLVSFRAPSVTSIGDGCFKNTGKTTFEFTSALRTVGANAFEGCQGFGPYLMGTEVTEIKSETFKGSKVRFEDLRGVTNIAINAFSDCNLKGQIVEENQSVKISGVPEITFDNAFVSGLVVTVLTSGAYKLYFITESSDAALRFTESSGTNTITSKYGVYGFYCEYKFNNTDLKVEGDKWTVHFPSDSGLKDMVRVTGEGSFFIPKPTMATELFKSWNIKGETGTRTEITEKEFAQLDPDIYLESTYNTMMVTYDHSAIPNASGLPTSGTFSVGDSYPTLPDTAGYIFTGWSVGYKSFAGGDRITTYQDHVAVSKWTVATFDVSVVSQGKVVSTKTVEANTALKLYQLSVTVPESKVLKGWSLQENGSVLTSDPIIDHDCSIYAIFGDKIQYTVRYLDGQTVLESVKVNDGSVLTIGQDNPVKEGKSFQNWELGDTGKKYYKGESLTVNGDLDLKAVWLNIQHTVTYSLGEHTQTSSYDYGTEITIGSDDAVKEGHELQGWSLSSVGEVQYHNGDKIVLKGDLMLYPVWKEIPEPTSPTTEPEQSTDSPDAPATTPETTPTTTPDTPSTPTVTPSTPTQTTTPASDQDKTTPGSSSGTVPKTEDDSSSAPSRTVTPVVQTSYSLKLMNGSSEFDTYSVNDGRFALSAAGTPVQTGYKFLGWSKTSTAKIPEYTSSSTVPVRSDTTLYAIWEKLVCVTFHDDTGTFSDTTYCENNGSIVLKDMNREGYIFKGWSENNSTTVLKGTMTVTRDLDLYPQWEPIKTEEETAPQATDPDTSAQTPADKNDTTEPTTPVTPASTKTSDGSDNSNAVMITVGAALAAAITAIVFIQFRRA